MPLCIWDARKTRGFRKALLAWYDTNKRDLPWRRNPDPYRVWISEIMLQQTQVQTVLPYYGRFLKRFPDLQALASGTEREVLSLWAGLGYYGRARNLRLAAQIIMRDFNGRFPEEIDSLLELPGVGRYTAGAIHSIAFDSPQPIVDGNVKRAISRLHGIRSGVPESFFWAQAKGWVSGERPSDFNQAVMELGALICTRHRPACMECPVRRFCGARKEGIQDQIPAPRRRRSAEKVELVVLILERADQLLVCENSTVSYIPGPYALPTSILSGGNSPEIAAIGLTRVILGAPVTLHARADVRHAITFRRILVHVFHASIDGRTKTRLRGSHSWLSRSEFDRFVTSALYRKVLDT